MTCGPRILILIRNARRSGVSERYPQDEWNDLQVFGIDGALFRTPDTPPLREHFGSGNTNYEQQTPFPMLRLVALMNIRSHVIADAAITPYRKGEIRIAEAFLVCARGDLCCCRQGKDGIHFIARETLQRPAGCPFIS